jgi:hypothetical protein
LHGLHWVGHSNFVLSADGQRWYVWNCRPTGEQRIQRMRKQCSTATAAQSGRPAAATAAESVRPAATALHDSEPVLQWGFAAAAAAATGLHGGFADRPKRAVE